LVQERPDVGERCDSVEPCVYLLPREPIQRRRKIDILASGELRVEACTQFQQCGDAALYIHRSCGRLESAADHLEQRRFSAAVTTNDADRLASGHLECYILDCPKLTVVARRHPIDDPSQPRHDHLLEAILWSVVDPIALRQPA